MNPGTLVILNLLGGIALLLWGVRMVRTGVMRVWGEQLKYFIQHRLGSRLTAFAAGTFATLIVGSGTATALIVTNIAATGSLPRKTIAGAIELRGRLLAATSLAPGLPVAAFTVGSKLKSVSSLFSKKP